MMYRMKNIVALDSEISTPKCMYSLKKLTEPETSDEMEINIRNQVITFLKQASNPKMTELEERQDQLLKKLDILYDRIKTISSYCNFNNNIATAAVSKTEQHAPSNIKMEEIVLVLSPDNIPWFLNIYVKQVKDFHVCWHIHSSVPNEKRSKIKAFFKKFEALYPALESKINIRLIFKCVAADSELKLSSLEMPIIGTVNIIRFLCIAYPNIIPYDLNDYQVDSLLDLCCLVERSPEKNKEAIIKKIFSQHKNWIYGNTLSIVDLAVYNIVKQWQSPLKYVPKSWFENFEKVNL